MEYRPTWRAKTTGQGCQLPDFRQPAGAIAEGKSACSSMPGMTTGTNERRQQPDRRRLPRGGRRPTDRIGYAPLVLVADDDTNSSARCEAILARLRFAVAPAHSADEALRVMSALRPNLVVAHLKDEASLRRGIESDPTIASVPVISLTPSTEDPEALVDEIRRVLRKPGA